MADSVCLCMCCASVCVRVFQDRAPDAVRLDVRPVVDNPANNHEVNHDIVLVKLGKNQELKFTAKAKKVRQQQRHILLLQQTGFL